LSTYAHGLDLIPEGLDAVEVRQAEQLVEALRETEARKALAQIVPAAILVRRLLHGGDDWREIELDGERHIDVDQRQLGRRGGCGGRRAVRLRQSALSCPAVRPACRGGSLGVDRSHDVASGLGRVLALARLIAIEDPVVLAVEPAPAP